MATTEQNRWGIYPARFGDIFLRQVDDVQYNAGVTKTEVIPGGAYHRAAAITAYAEPTITLKTRDFDGLLTSPYIVDIVQGYRCGVGAGWSSLDTLVQYQRRKEGGIFSNTTGEHILLTNTKGFLCFDEIRAEQDSVTGAEAMLRYHCLSNNWDTEPVEMSDDASGLANTPSYRGVWYLGPTIEESVGMIDGMLGVTINPGIDFRVKRADGGPYATSGSIHSVKPEVKFRLSKLSNYYFQTGGPLHGNPIVNGSNSFNIYLQKGEHGGHRFPWTDAVHIRIRVEFGDNTSDSISVTGEDDAVIEYTVRPTTVITATRAVQIT